jgi:hypothetical protein
VNLGGSGARANNGLHAERRFAPSHEAGRFGPTTMKKRNIESLHWAVVLMVTLALGCGVKEPFERPSENTRGHNVGTQERCVSLDPREHKGT